MVKYTRVQYKRLNDQNADLLWEFITLPPSELTHLESAIIYDVPSSMVERGSSHQEFTLASDPYGKKSRLVCKTSRSPDKHYELSTCLGGFTGVTIKREDIDSNRYKMYPGSRFSGCSILTTRVQAHQEGWGHKILFSRYKKYPCPYVNTLQDNSDYFFKGYSNEIELTVLGDVCDDIILKIVTANLPRCFGHFKK